jgi:hypothetical protein
LFRSFTLSIWSIKIFDRLTWHDNHSMEYLHSQIQKENRTYDQILGDPDGGNGDPALVVFPEHLTPNHHALARQLFTPDNTYCSGEVADNPA